MRFLLCFFIGLNLFSIGAMEWSHGVNVKTFGARGDGVSDDTAAIQQALNSIRKLNHRKPLVSNPITAGAPELQKFKAISWHSENVREPELFFPSGTYRITDTLVGTGDISLRGEKDSVIFQTVPEKNILYINVCHQ